MSICAVQRQGWQELATEHLTQVTPGRIHDKFKPEGMVPPPSQLI